MSASPICNFYEDDISFSSVSYIRTPVTIIKSLKNDGWHELCKSSWYRQQIVLSSTFFGTVGRLVLNILLAVGDNSTQELLEYR